MSSFAYEALKRYVINRATRPKLKNSGMTFAYGNDSFLQNGMRKPIKRGQYMLAEDEKLNIEWIDGTQMKWVRLGIYIKKKQMLRRKAK